MQRIKSLVFVRWDMRKSTKIFIAVFCILTVLIMGFNYIWQDQNPALISKFSIRLLMVAIAIGIKKENKYQTLLAVAFGFTLFSDFFFVLMRCFSPDFAYRNLLGIVGFMVAYLFLVLAFSQGFRFNRFAFFTALPFSVVYLAVLIDLYRYVAGAVLVAATILGLIMVVMATVLIGTLKRETFPKRAAVLASISAVLLFGSDMVVAYSLFHPAFHHFILVKENFIWATYMAGWLALLCIVDDRQ